MATPKTKCANCGTSEEDLHDWHHCTECGDYFCPECTSRMEEKETQELLNRDPENREKAKRKLTENKTLDKHERLTLTCPACEIELDSLST